MTVVVLDANVKRPAGERPQQHKWDTTAKRCSCGRVVCADALAETAALAQQIDIAAEAIASRKRRP